MEHVDMETEHRGVDTRERESLGELLGRLAGSSAALVRQEIALARVEARELIQSVRTLATIMAVAAVFAMAAVGSLVAAAVIALAERMGTAQAALAVGFGLALLAAVIAAIGFASQRRARARHEAHSRRSPAERGPTEVFQKHPRRRDG